MKTKKIILILMCLFLLSGCTKTLKDKDNNVVTNNETGQSITENIICKPTNKDVIKIYEKNGVKVSKLPPLIIYRLSDFNNELIMVFLPIIAKVVSSIALFLSVVYSGPKKS